jgi:hypothetical protein
MQMDANKCCPFCVPPVDYCPHLLIAMGRPGEVHGGALGERLRQLWEIVIGNVGDDPAADLRGVYSASWQELRDRFAAEADLVIDGDTWIAMYLQEPARMDAVVEKCIAADDL